MSPLGARRLLCLSLALAGCASGKSKYEESLAAADANARAGQAEEAARLYRQAADQTSKRDLAVEAAYREAWLWQRQGDTERALACLEQLVREEPASRRSGRIWLDIGRWREASGDVQGARNAYRKVLDHPESGLGTRAADALARSSPGPRSDVYRKLLPQAKDFPDLASFLRLRTAQAEAAEGQPEHALATCETLAKTDPLPKGVYTDDALLLAARLRRELGDPRGALVTLDALLSAQEKSAFVGSYERPAFAEARWLAADIYQHELDDNPRARRMLDDLTRLDATSRLRDDAFFRAAWLAEHVARDHEGACARARLLAALDPPSPLEECLGEVCTNMKKSDPPTRRCIRAIEMARGPDQTAGAETAVTEAQPEEPIENTANTASP